MNYKDFTVEEFIADEQFINWVKNPDSTSNDFWNNWLTQYPEKSDQIEEAKAFILGLQFNNHPAFTEEQEYLILEQIHQQLAPTRPSLNRFISTQWMAAASILLLFGLVTFVWTNSKQTYQTNYGEIREIQLQDHSKIMLNANSVLKTKRYWRSDQPREVWLEGEAFFEVSHWPEKGGDKFLVHAGDVTIEVLGTQFNVNHRSAQTNVILTEGKVKISTSNKNEAILEQPVKKKEVLELVEYQAEDNIFERKPINPVPYLSWRDKELIFHDTPLTELVSILEDSYGYEVRIEDPGLLRDSLTGSMVYEEKELLLGIEAVFEIDVVHNGQKNITLRKKPQ